MIIEFRHFRAIMALPMIVAIGFVLVAYMNLSILPVAIVGAAVAYEYYKRQAASTTETVAVEGGFDEDE